MQLERLSRLLDQRERHVADLRARLDAVELAEQSLYRELRTTPDLLNRLYPPDKVLLNHVAEILANTPRTRLPMPTRDILAKLRDRTLLVNGYNPTANLSAKLSRDPRFRASQRRGTGWTLTQLPS